MEITYRNCTAEEFESVFRDDHPGKPLWPDFSDARRVSHLYGAVVDEKIRGAIAFDEVAYEQIEEEGHDLTLSYLSFQYVSVAYRNKGIGTTLLTYAINLLIAADRIPIGCAVTSSQMMRCYKKLPPELKSAVVLLHTDLDDGHDVWEEHGL